MGVWAPSRPGTKLQGGGSAVVVEFGHQMSLRRGVAALGGLRFKTTTTRVDRFARSTRIKAQMHPPILRLPHVALLLNLRYVFASLRRTSMC